MNQPMRLQLKVDKDLYNNAKKLADDVGVSLNRFVNSLLKWAIETGHPGEPKFDQGDFYKTEPMPKVVWFGEERESEPEYDQVHGELPRQTKTVVQLVLDFRDSYRLPPPQKGQQKP
jgi:hypothetical protein